MARLEHRHLGGWWELYQVICADCGWRSSGLGIDPVLNRRDWLIANCHQCIDTDD